jgi:acyl-CoA synthetase (AMP-forming)/AMP-acid ligase II
VLLCALSAAAVSVGLAARHEPRGTAQMLYTVTHPLRFMQGLGLMDADSSATLMKQFEGHAAADPDRIFLIFEGQRFSYGQANGLINQHAHSYAALGIGHGDVVALLLENRPAFLWHLFGLHKLGAIGSLINTHLVGESLAHAIHICRPRHVVVGSEMWAAFEQVRSRLPEISPDMVDIDHAGAGAGANGAPVAVWNDRLQNAARTNPTPNARITLSDQAAYIYTSGTTGLPKAAVVRHSRFFRAAAVWAGLAFRWRPGDVLYNCLPLYHANGLLLATSSVVSAGVTMVLARKFSRKHFWEDIRENGATGFIYIGELCRYLMNNPPSPLDRQHKVRVISGNGLRPDIWRGFKERFGIERIAEFYGSTEGNAITVNALNIEGSVGVKLPGMVIVRWNDQADDFARDARGRLIRAKIGEAGVLLGEIRRRAEFDGYHDKQASESKVVRDAFKPGDAYFNTGDLMREDRLRQLYFVDRLGDTFRWKGENVATSEVQEHLATFDSIQEVNVYGVNVPGAEGRAGMAALVLSEGQLDVAALRAHIERGLPPFARPVFLRVLPELNTTSTFKLKKGDLQSQGFDPSKTSDPLYVFHAKQREYVPLTPELFQEISSGRLPL